MSILTSEAILIVFGFLAFLASFPQLIKLIRLKNSDQFSTVSWVIFLLYQLSSLAYAWEIGSQAYIGLNIVWSIFYAVMLGLILRYKRARKPARR